MRAKLVASEFVQRQINRLLEEAGEAISQLDWQVVNQRAQAVLALEPENVDGIALLAAAERALGNSSTTPSAQSPRAPTAVAPTTTNDQPTSFANGRYQVKRFLGEGGRKRVYLAQDTLLDREVAFALIKTEGLDEVSRTRITREAQAMGRLGSHPHIVTVFDLGDHEGQPQMVTDDGRRRCRSGHRRCHRPPIASGAGHQHRESTQFFDLYIDAIASRCG